MLLLETAQRVVRRRVQEAVLGRQRNGLDHGVGVFGEGEGIGQGDRSAGECEYDFGEKVRADELEGEMDEDGRLGILPPALSASMARSGDGTCCRWFSLVRVSQFVNGHVEGSNGVVVQKKT